jgi:hypothetical protein
MQRGILKVKGFRPVHEDSQPIMAELLGQVQRAHQLFLSAADECVPKAERHYRHVRSAG